MAGWAIVLDYTILIAVTALTVPAYLAAFWAPLGPRRAGDHRRAGRDRVGAGRQRHRRQRAPHAPADLRHVADLGLQAIVIVLGLALASSPAPADRDDPPRPAAPASGDLAFALPIAIVAFTGLEAAASLSGEVAGNRNSLKRLVLPGLDGDRAHLRRHLARRRRRAARPPRGHASSVSPTSRRRSSGWWRRSARTGSPTCSSTRSRSAVRSGLIAAAGSRHARRLPGRVLAGHQPPDPQRRRAAAPAVGHAVRDHGPGRGGGRRAGAADRPRAADRDLRVRRAAVVHDRARLGHRACASATPSARAGTRSRSRCRIGGGSVPIPAVLGRAAVVRRLDRGAGASISDARYVGLGWLLAGLLLYVTYRKSESKPLLKRVTIPERALRHEALEPDFGSILVPIFGSRAGRRHRPDRRTAGRRGPRRRRGRTGR